MTRMDRLARIVDFEESPRIAHKANTQLIDEINARFSPFKITALQKYLSARVKKKILMIYKTGIELMKLKYLLSILILIVGLLVVWSTPSRELTEEEKQWQADHTAYQEYIVYVNEVHDAFARKMFEEMDLVSVGGSGSMHGKAEEIGMKFHAYRRATIEEARVFHLLVMEKFVEAINAHEKLRPFLAESPFTYERVSIALSFNSPFGPYSDGSVMYVSNVPGLKTIAEQNRNRLSYRAYDPFEGKLVSILKESHEEAVQRARKAPVENPSVHQITPLEKAIDEVFMQYLDEMKKEYGFRCEAIGGKMNNYVDEIGVSFLAFQRATQEEARKLIIPATEKLLQMINRNEKLKPYFMESPFQLDRLKIRIKFRERNFISYRDGSMESVRLEGGAVNYFQHVQMGADVYPVHPPLFASETYEQAKTKE